MRRHRAGKSTAAVSLFPFLAVLICTMGALIVLLVLLVQLARAHAEEDAEQRDLLELPDAQTLEKQDHEWHRELFEQQREKAKQDLARQRLELSHLEEHLRELEQRWETLNEAAAQLQAQRRGDTHDQNAARGQLAELREAIESARRDLEEARAAAQSQPPRYAIIPYVGPNGTYRRPVYLECTAEGVVIHPEGVTLQAADLLGPLGPGNPLDAALRAMREYYVRQATAGTQQEPYPLIIVRPDGVEAYAAARAAMRNWEDEFGYELIDADMVLEFPAADPDLVRLLEKTVADARSRQQILAAAMPSRFSPQPEVGFVASPSRGGFQPQGGADDVPRGQRRGGFGHGGDERYIDGAASGTVAGAAPPLESQTVGGPMQKGHAEGVPNAQQGGAVAPVARTRGRNWGLPTTTANATGVVRPIRVACLPDRLIILPERGETRTPEVVLVSNGMLESLDAFVAKIWDRIEGWGIAVAGGYWKPELRVQVAQGAEQRFAELQTLLEGSGLEVRRIEP